MTALARLTLLGILLATPLAVGCGDSGGGPTGPDPSFMAVAPCSMESSYTTTGTTITFPAAATDFNYSPKCLKVTAGSTVTFSGDFSAHPLDPSETRGNTTSNPIMLTTTGTSAPFTFPAAGFYAYYCQFHGADNGQFMDGVIWVK
jgi:plastocyanin